MSKLIRRLMMESNDDGHRFDTTCKGFFRYDLGSKAHGDLTGCNGKRHIERMDSGLDERRRTLSVPQSGHHVAETIDVVRTTVDYLSLADPIETTHWST